MYLVEVSPQGASLGRADTARRGVPLGRSRGVLRAGLAPPGTAHVHAKTSLRRLLPAVQVDDIWIVVAPRGAGVTIEFLGTHGEPLSVEVLPRDLARKYLIRWRWLLAGRRDDLPPRAGRY